MKELVLLVDDDKLPMLFYVKALEQKGLKVKHCLEPDSTLDFVRKRGEQIEAIVLDIMLSPGKAYKNKNTAEGLRTGLFLLMDIRKHCPDVPVVVLTNVKNPVTLDEFKGKPLLKVAQKMDCPPFELAELVCEMVNKHKEKSG